MDEHAAAFGGARIPNAACAVGTILMAARSASDGSIASSAAAS